MSLSIVTIVGARPQFIKAAPVARALAQAGLRETMVHTGQHFDATMSDVFFTEFDLASPKHHLDVHSLPHGAMTGRMLEQIEQILLAERPDWVLVYGDTNSTLAGALAAAKLHIPVAHVEAGLRSFNRRMPEEVNRVMADHLSTLLFCPTQTAAHNLRAEGVERGVQVVGDVMYDAALEAAARAQSQSSILQSLDLAPKTYAVATIHRAENTDDPTRLNALMDWLSHQGRAAPVIFPVHPRTRKILELRAAPPDGVRLVDPLGYIDMTQLVRNAEAVFTDSGGLQKEAYFHRVPCVTMRDETEWVETIACGWNRLWTVDSYAPRRDISDYGDGDTARRIAEILRASA